MVVARKRNKFAGGYEDLLVNSYSLGVAGAPTRVTFPTGSKCSAFSYANNGTERGLDFETQLPHGYANGSTHPVYMHIHMSPSVNFAAGSPIGFLVELLLAKNLGAWTKETYWCSYTPSAQIDAETQFMTVDVPLSAAHQALFEPSVYIKGSVFRHKGTQYATTNAGNITENINQNLFFHELDFHVWRYRAGTTINQSSY